MVFTEKELKEKDIGSLFQETKLSEETFKEILNIGNKELNKFIENKVKLIDELETEDKQKLKLLENYRNIIDILKYYCHVEEKYYNIIALWIIGAMNINTFNTYPYLFINAMKGSGKTRLLKLITSITGGDVLNSLTEAVLFRTKGTLAIDEFEGVNRKGNEALRELLNSAYKKGVKVKRLRKAKTVEGDQQIVEEFEVFRPIIIANIWGMEEVLGDRCIKIILDKVDNPLISKKIERFRDDLIINIQCSLCSVVSIWNVYNYIEMAWNDYISNRYTTLTTYTTYTTLTTLTTQQLNFFEKIDKSGLYGRILELAFPLLFISNYLDKEIFEKTLKTFMEMNEERLEEDRTENTDVSLIDMVSQEIEKNKFISIKEITEQFKIFIQRSDEWINERWMGRALKRLNLIKEKRRRGKGIEIMFDIDKAQKKMEMFK